MECNQKIQVLFVSSPGAVIPDFVRSPLLTAIAIILQFQGGVDAAIDTMRLVVFAGARLWQNCCDVGADTTNRRRLRSK